MKSFYVFCAFISIISYHSGESTLSQSDKKAKKDGVNVKKDTSKSKTGPIASSVYSKGLVTTKLTSSLIFWTIILIIIKTLPSTTLMEPF